MPATGDRARDDHRRAGRAALALRRGRRASGREVGLGEHDHRIGAALERQHQLTLEPAQVRAVVERLRDEHGVDVRPRRPARCAPRRPSGRRARTPSDAAAPRPPSARRRRRRAPSRRSPAARRRVAARTRPAAVSTVTMPAVDTRDATRRTRRAGPRRLDRGGDVVVPSDGGEGVGHDTLRLRAAVVASAPCANSTSIACSRTSNRRSIAALARAFFDDPLFGFFVPNLVKQQRALIAFMSAGVKDAAPFGDVLRRARRRQGRVRGGLAAARASTRAAPCAI